MNECYSGKDYMKLDSLLHNLKCEEYEFHLIFSYWKSRFMALGTLLDLQSLVSDGNKC